MRWKNEQKAIEKTLKAVLAAKAVRYLHTHDLLALINLGCASGLIFPVALEDIVFLTSFAAEARYDDLPKSPSAREHCSVTGDKVYRHGHREQLYEEKREWTKRTLRNR